MAQWFGAVLSSSTELRQVFEYAPEWEPLLKNWDGNENPTTADFFCRVGARAIFLKTQALENRAESFVRLLRDQYYLPTLSKMMLCNQNFRRFLAQRSVAADEQKSYALSLSIELAAKLETALLKQLSAGKEDGYKVLLPPYIQRSVHNAVIDYIKLEASWEKSTMQDVYLDPEKDDPRTTIADESYIPETLAVNAEAVKQLNQLRTELKQMLADSSIAREPLFVLDCMFGLGLTPHSKVGEEMTMRECCEVLTIQAETMPRRIARCQVLMDKGLDLVRQRIYKRLPGIADCWQRGLNVNCASRRELTQLVGLTEGEVERLIKGRQFVDMTELVNTGVIKDNRLAEILQKGALAVFVPVEINSACSRDIIDILGLSKDSAQKIVSERPFKNLDELLDKKLVSKTDLELLIRRGAAIKSSSTCGTRLDLNRATPEELTELGVDEETASCICRFRPFLTWSELEELLGSDKQFPVLRQKFFLGIISS